MNNSPQRAAKGFTRAFWVSNTVELFERIAYYAVFIVLTIYLSSILGFNDFEASMISGLFSGGLYLLPIFSGAYADKIGFRKSMIIAFSLLSIGYLGLGVSLDDKTVVPFVVSGSSSPKGAWEDIRKYCPKAKIFEGFHRTQSEASGCEADLKAWLQRLKLI